MPIKAITMKKTINKNLKKIKNLMILMQLSTIRMGLIKKVPM